ncbi:MAG: hypothetical protein IH621_08955 [Krumholzibacteria bacterium]|nr:hypothetical protein [Candidatus Krumholzibacteria bacterium]
MADDEGTRNSDCRPAAESTAARVESGNLWPEQRAGTQEQTGAQPAQSEVGLTEVREGWAPAVSADTISSITIDTGDDGPIVDVAPPDLSLPLTDYADEDSE